MQFKIFLLLLCLVFAAGQDDIDIVADPCPTEEIDLDTCIRSNGCDGARCPDDLFASVGNDETDPLSGQTDPSALLDQVNSYFSNFCGNLKNEMCRARSCCSECTDEFNVYFECTATIASSYIRESVEEFQGALAAILAGNTEEEGGEETEFGATCNLSDHTCDGGGGDRITGSDSGASSEAIGLVVASTALVAALIMV